MKNNPIISIILPVYNSENYILECLESIKNQTMQNFEVILIDDKSTDKSLKITKCYLKNNLYGKFKIIRNKSNIGITRSLNKAFKISNGKYIARIDADDINKPDRFEIQFKYLEKNHDISIVGSNVEYIDKDSRFIHYSDLPLSHMDIKSSLFLYNPIIHSTIFFRKKIFSKYPYNEKFNTSQDYEMYCRIIHSHKFTNIRKSLVKFRFHDQSISSHKKKLQKKNSLVIQKRYYKNNFKNLFPTNSFKLFTNLFMSDYKKIFKNISDLKKFFIDMLMFFNDLNKKIKNVQLEYFFLERLLIFFKYAKGYKLFMLSLILRHFRIKVIIRSIFNIFFRKVKTKFKSKNLIY